MTMWQTIMDINNIVKKLIDRFKWVALCSKCNMKPDAHERNECKHEWEQGSFIVTHCIKCGKSQDGK